VRSVAAQERVEHERREGEVIDELCLVRAVAEIRNVTSQ
jgi:hypothetical protein